MKSLHQLTHRSKQVWSCASLASLVPIVVLLLTVMASPAAAHPGDINRAGAGQHLMDGLPAGSKVTLFPAYPSASDAGTPNGLASVGQPANFRITIPQPVTSPSWTEQGYTVDISIVEVHHEGATCAQSEPAIKVISMVSNTSNELAVENGFAWPAAATSTAYGSPYYALCTHVDVTSSQFTVPDYFTGGPADINTTNNIFKVISDHAPGVKLSPTPVAVGETLTVTGFDWVPVYADQSNTTVGVNIDQYIPHTYQIVNYINKRANVDTKGNFTVSFSITSAYAPGPYYICVGSINYDVLCSGYATGVEFNIVQASSSSSGGGSKSQSTPSPTQATATTSATSTVSSLGTSTSPRQATGSSTGGTSALVWVFVTVAVVVLLGIVIGGSIWWVRRPKDPRWQPQDPRWQPQDPRWQPQESQWQQQESQWQQQDPRWQQQGPRWQPPDSRWEPTTSRHPDQTGWWED